MNFAPVAFMQQQSNAKSIQFISYSGFTNDASSYTGTTTLDAGMYAICLHNEGSSGRGTNSVVFKNATFGDTSGTERVDQTNGSVAAALYTVTLANNGTYDIVTTLTSTTNRFLIAIYKLNNMSSIVPIDATFTSSGSANSLSFTNSTIFGYGIATSTVSSQNAAPVTWSITGSSTGITKNYDETTESLVSFSGAQYYQYDGANTTITATFSTTSNGLILGGLWE